MMGFEEGEIVEQITDTVEAAVVGDHYDPSYEWPGDNTDTSMNHEDALNTSKKSPTNLRPNQPTFRLVVLRTTILPSKQRLVVIDGYSEVQFGRDIVPPGSTTPKVRLKEMEVSKLHATVYWDAIRREWGVVDMGSVHGTFLQADSTPKSRLSPPRQASIPRKLKHMDQLIIGSTIFSVHLHNDRLPCEECWTSGDDEIPLFAKSSKTCSGVSSRAESPGSYTPTHPKDAKKALNSLKQIFLERHGDSRSQSDSGETSNQYVDRSARRRSLMPASRPDAPGVPSLPPPVRPDPPMESPRVESPVAQVTSQPPAPLQSTNVGHRLLMKQGWVPGTALGLQDEEEEGGSGLVEPIEVKTSENRGGLGHKRSGPVPGSVSQADPDWKERAKRRRWEGDSRSGS